MKPKDVRKIEAGDCIRYVPHMAAARAMVGIVEMAGKEHHCIRWIATGATDILDLKSPMWEHVE